MTDEEIAFAEIIGDLVEQWGFKRHLGRIWSLVYLREQPVSPTDIQEQLALSAGTVSTALSELQTWGVVKRIRVAGDRNFYYEADTHIWRSISTVLRTRELRILEEAEGGLSALAETLGRGSRGDAVFQMKRIKHIHSAVETALSLFGGLIEATPLSLPRLTKIFQRLKTL